MHAVTSYNYTIGILTIIYIYEYHIIISSYHRIIIIIIIIIIIAIVNIVLKKTGFCSTPWAALQACLTHGLCLATDHGRHLTVAAALVLPWVPCTKLKIFWGEACAY